jgi:hypothetical protein
VVVGAAVATGVGDGVGDGVCPAGDGDGVDGPLVGPLMIVGVPTGVVATGVGEGAAYGPTVAPPLHALSAPAHAKARTATDRCRKRNNGDKNVLLENRRHRKRARTDTEYIGKTVS